MSITTYPLTPETMVRLTAKNGQKLLNETILANGIAIVI